MASSASSQAMYSPSARDKRWFRIWPMDLSFGSADSTSDMDPTVTEMEEVVVMEDQMWGITGSNDGGGRDDDDDDDVDVDDDDDGEVGRCEKEAEESGRGLWMGGR